MSSKSNTKEGEPMETEKTQEVLAVKEPTSTRKRPRSPHESSASSADKSTSVSAASAAAAAQLSATMGWQGLYTLLSQAAHQSSNSTSTSLPTVAQVRAQAQRVATDSPPFCHLSKTDSAPQLKVVEPERRLILKGGMRGYRMSRASQGTVSTTETGAPVTAGTASSSTSVSVSTAASGKPVTYYYEVWILDPPKVSDIVAGLPSNVRMGPKLQKQLQQALEEEKSGLPLDERKSTFGGHVRLGWSMRTGDLQAPVGYDKWSFAIRDIDGAKLHESERVDSWGGFGFGPGDVIGCSITLHGGNEPKPDTVEEQPKNYLRFYKNGKILGNDPDGVAFECPEGVYYPAISLYMGASVQFNPGPHFVYPPKKLPGLPKKQIIQPISILTKEPISVEEALQTVQKDKAFRKPEVIHAFQELVRAEVEVLQSSYRSHRRAHAHEIQAARAKRELKTDDVERDPFFTSAEDDATMEQES